MGVGSRLPHGEGSGILDFFRGFRGPFFSLVRVGGEYVRREEGVTACVWEDRGIEVGPGSPLDPVGISPGTRNHPWEPPTME